MQIRDIRRIEDVIRANQNVISASHPVLFGGLAEATWKCRFLMMMKFLFLFLLQSTHFYLEISQGCVVLPVVVAPLHYNMIKDKAMKFCIAEQRVFNDIKD